jgi:hypothetical protein
MAAMAKKKTQSKKHKFKHVEAAAVAGGMPQAEALVHEHATATTRVQPLHAAAITGGRDFSYVASDLRRISVMAVILIALEVLLWALLSHTGAGDAVYSFIKL